LKDCINLHELMRKEMGIYSSPVRGFVAKAPRMYI